MFCIKAVCPVAEHFIPKSNTDPAQDNTHKLELKGKRLSGGWGHKVRLRAETKVKKGSRRRKKGSRGKENNKPWSNWACTTTNVEGWGKCTEKLLCYSQCCAFFLKQPTKEKALHTYSLDLFWKVCSLKKILSNWSPSAPAALVCKVMPTPIAIINMKQSVCV